MERCFKLIPQRSYNKYGYVLLALFVSIGIVVIGIATAFDLKATLQCKPDKTLANDLPTRKYIETECLIKYAQEFHLLLPFYLLIVMNFGLVLLLNICYAIWAKDRVEIFADASSATTIGNDEESQPLSGISKAASDPLSHKTSRRFSVFEIYIMHLMFCRIIPLAVFATLLLISSNFPVQFHCPWHIETSSNPLLAGFTGQSIPFSTVDCTYSMGSNKEAVAALAVTINFIIGAATLIELIYLLWSGWKDDNFLTDMEFCSVYILRKRKRIRKLIKKIRENITDDCFRLHDDFGEERLSRRKLKEMYINVIIQEGRESASRRRFEDRHGIFKAHLEAPAGCTTITTTADLFKPTPACKTWPRAILVVGRPGIGKTLLTKKIFYQWQQQEFELWRDKIVVVIRFRKFNKDMGKTSLREMLRHSEGFNMSSADFNAIFEYICLMPSKAVFIFDGLDELNVNDEILNEESPVNNNNQVTHILLILKQLVKGHLLPGITVLTTSRPTAEHIYQDLEFDREVEILGFHKEQIKEYVERFCRDDVQSSSRIWNLIERSPELSSLCYIPVNSYIVCLTLKESIGAESQHKMPKTITELYKRAIKILLYRHHLKYKDKSIPKDYMIAKLPEDLQNDLNKLKEIARDGMINDQLLFEFESVDKLLVNLGDCGLLNKLEDKRQNIFCFLHLTIQEFLAAQRVVDDMKSVELFLSDQFNNHKWYLVIQFVAGLIGDKMRELKEEKNRLERYSYILCSLVPRRFFLKRI